MEDVRRFMLKEPEHGQNDVACLLVTFVMQSQHSTLAQSTLAPLLNDTWNHELHTL